MKIKSNRNRITGTILSVYDNRDGSFTEDSDSKWITVCEDHGSILYSDSRALAVAACTVPDWCEDCQPDCFIAG